MQGDVATYSVIWSKARKGNGFSKAFYGNNPTSLNITDIKHSYVAITYLSSVNCIYSMHA